MIKLKEAILLTMYNYDNILSVDFERILLFYSKNPKKYILNLRESEDIELDKKTNLLSLTKTNKKKIKNQYPNWNYKNNQVTNHDLISFEVLLHFLTNFEVTKIETEKNLISSSLRADLIITTNDNNYYIESDNGTERAKEIESKISQYKLNLEGVLLFVSNSINNIKTSLNLTLNDQRIIIININDIHELKNKLNLVQDYKLEATDTQTINIEYQSDNKLMNLVLGLKK